MNKFERTKHEKDGLDAWPDIQRAAREGHEVLSDDDKMRLKWFGLYAHNTGDGYFMLRVKVVQGILTVDQADVLASIATDFGRDVIDCTTRQCVQFHWIRLDDVEEIFERISSVGLTSSGACGDITRNIVGNTLAGIAADEIADGHAAAEAIHAHFLDNKTYSNLPRKYKISINGRPTAHGRGLINCVAIQAAVHDDGTHGFNIRVGGGLSSAPRLARCIDVFASPQELPEVMGAVTAVYRDSEENRAKRGKARVKFLVDNIGPDGYRERVVEELGWDPRRAAPLPAEAPQHDHIGVTAQKDGEHSAVGLCIPVGRLSGSDFGEIARLAREYSTRGELRLTHQQNALIPYVPDERVGELLAEPLLGTYTPHPKPFARNTQSCTGKEFCGLAKTWTKGIVEPISQRLDERFAALDLGDDFRFHFAGCSSSCAQHQIADIGVEGTLKRVDGEMVDAFDIRIGGRVQGTDDPRFNEVILARVPWWDLEPALERAIALYGERRSGDGESFRAFTSRVGLDWWRENLQPVEGERPAGAGKHLEPEGGRGTAGGTGGVPEAELVGAGADA